MCEHNNQEWHTLVRYPCQLELHYVTMKTAQHTRQLTTVRVNYIRPVTKGENKVINMENTSRTIKQEEADISYTFSLK